MCSLAEQSLPFNTHDAVGVICIGLPGSHGVAYEITPRCHVSIPVIPALRKTSSLFNFGGNVDCDVKIEEILESISPVVHLSYDRFDWLGTTQVMLL